MMVVSPSSSNNEWEVNCGLDDDFLCVYSFLLYTDVLVFFFLATQLRVCFLVAKVIIVCMYCCKTHL